MSDTLKVGVIGTGMIGCEHIANVGALPGATVVAVEASPAGGTFAGSLSPKSVGLPLVHNSAG